MGSGFISVDGDRLLDPAGEPLVLRGVNLGGWMLMENFIDGYPATESLARAALREAMGEARYERFSELFLRAFYDDPDARLIASLGLNCVRLPINYRHFEDDLHPFELRMSGFDPLDRVVELNARHGLYSVIDLHAAQGWQNHAWHSDNHTLEPLLWQHRQFQDRAVWLWEQLAAHYRGNPWVAGYNLLNEPSDKTGARLSAFYRRAVAAVRIVDPDHVIFLDGNTYSRDFESLGDPIPGTVYVLHHYPQAGRAGARGYPGTVDGRPYDRADIEREFLDRSSYMRRHGSPIWVGEFGPVYDPDPATLPSKLGVLADQLDIYEAHGASWTSWCYKDVDVHGLAYLRPSTAWRRRVDPIIAKKRRLAAGFWDVPDTTAAQLFAPIIEIVEREFPNLRWYPFGAARQVWSVVGEKMLAEFLIDDFRMAFSDVDDDEIEALAGSFRLESCDIRPGLANLLESAARTGRARSGAA